MLLNKLILTAAAASVKKPLTQNPLVLDKVWRGMETTSCVKHPNDAILFRQVILREKIYLLKLYNLNS
jgi:hypothetical protein